jgi:DNA-binding MarR family transcriptional regulator
MEPKFVLSDSARLAVLEELMRGDSFLDDLARRQHLIPTNALRVVEEMRQRGIVEVYGNIVSLTPRGKAMAKRVKDYQMPYPTMRVPKREKGALIRIAPNMKRDQIKSRRL